MTRANSAAALLGPVAVLALVGVVGSFMTASRALEFTNALVFAAIVVALYVFVGNSGVLSFGFATTRSATQDRLCSRRQSEPCTHSLWASR
jgi:hypothetical protein